MSTAGSQPGVRKETAKALSGARRKAVLAFLVLPIVFAAALLVVLFLATNWPYPPGFEFVSRWTPADLFVAGCYAIGLYVLLCVLMVWRLAARWLWEPAASIVNVIEKGDAASSLAHAGPPSDMAQLLYRIELAADRHRSAAEGAMEIEEVQSAVSRLCDEISQLGARRFDRDFSSAKGSLEPLGKSLAECCTELSGFMGGCAEVVSQITGTLFKAQARAAGLASRAENAFVGHSELSVGAKEFTKRVGEALSIAALEARGDSAEESPAAGSLKRISWGLDECAGLIERISREDSAAKEISADSKKLADEATVIALNAAIEASRSGSANLETLADNARRLAEEAMELGEKVESVSGGYLEAVREAAAALVGLRGRMSAWLQETHGAESKRTETAGEIEEFLVSVGDMASSLARSVESVAGLSETASTEAQSAKRAIDEALGEMESLKRRLGGQGA